MNSPAKKLSIIFPVYQNYENASDLLKEIKDFSIKVDKYELELIFVDDGSTDNSFNQLLKIKKSWF